jgi:hypothetical protein
MSPRVDYSPIGLKWIVAKVLLPGDLVEPESGDGLGLVWVGTTMRNAPFMSKQVLISCVKKPTNLNFN